jgi:hypothetical protein
VICRPCVLAFFCALLAGCRSNEDDRRSLLETAERTNYGIARGTAVRDLRSPSDTGRLIYEPPTPLAQRHAEPSGAPQVWAPFGIAKPDTVPPTTTR